jgi:hypothetical protein
VHTLPRSPLLSAKSVSCHSKQISFPYNTWRTTISWGRCPMCARFAISGHQVISICWCGNTF